MAAAHIAKSGKPTNASPNDAPTWTIPSRTRLCGGSKGNKSGNTELLLTEIHTILFGDPDIVLIQLLTRNTQHQRRTPCGCYGKFAHT